MAIARDDLLDHVAAQIGTQPLTATQIDTLLDIARVAAHGTGDRTSAPLVTFLAGIAAARGDDRAVTIAEVQRDVAEIAPIEDD